MVVVQELVLKIIMQILFIFNEYDASIKKLNNIYIDKETGYELNGTMIGCNLLDDPTWGSEYITAYQVENKIYATYGYDWTSGFDFTNYDSHANIIYI